jgi:hypothetical protein
MKKSIFNAVCSLILIAAFPASLCSAEKFQIEIYSGYSTLGATDLNRLPENDDLTRIFLYDRLYDVLQTYGGISSWSSVIDGIFGKIANDIPFGFRIKYYLSSALALSAGFRSVSAAKNSSPTFSYIRTKPGGAMLMDRKAYSQYTLSADGYVPQVGIHLEKRISKVISFEGFAAAGILFARCRYVSQWQAQYLDITSYPETILFEEEGSLEQAGKGTGIAIDGGVRINVLLGKRLGLYVGAGYAFQSSTNLEGKGKEVRGNRIEEWEGEWGIKSEQLNAYWGSLSMEVPTNYWTGNAAGERTGDFKLDLSGLQLRVGLFYRF